MTVAPFPVGLSDGFVEELADAVEAAGEGRHAPVFAEWLLPYSLRWRMAGVSDARVRTEVARVHEAVAITIALRRHEREVAVQAGGDGA